MPLTNVQKHTLIKCSTFEVEAPPISIADRLYKALASAETGGEANPWIRTRVSPEGGSSAYGPVQMTKSFMDDFTTRRTNEFNPQQLTTASNLSNQAGKFLEFGNEPNKVGYDPKWDYGGTGTLTTDADKTGYKDLAKQLIMMQYNNAGQDVSAFLKRWRGQTPEAAYTERFMNTYNAQ